MEKQYYIENLTTGKFYSGWEGDTVKYVDTKEGAKIISEADLGQELINLRLKGELVEHREVLQQ